MTQGTVLCVGSIYIEQPSAVPKTADQPHHRGGQPVRPGTLHFLAQNQQKAQRQLTFVTVGSKSATYAYDADGIRTQKTVGTEVHTYVTQNGKVVRETIGTGSTAKVLDFIYDNQGQPFALKYSTNGGSSFTTYYYVLNLQGDVVKLISYIPGFEYEAVASYTYDAWGNIVSSSGSMASINPLRYRSYYYDTETGFYYLQSRYYDPAIHRFINADSYASTGQGFVGTNMLAYCKNNPVSRVDTCGTYDRDAAIDYAEEWYDGQNTNDYQYFGGRGGDCANFTSQCLSAGGIKKRNGWHCYKTSHTGIVTMLISLIINNTAYCWSYSDSWKFADEQYEYFASPTNGLINGPVLKITSTEQLEWAAKYYNVQKGDLLYFASGDGTDSIYHSTMISSVNDDTICYTAHSRPCFDQPVNEMTFTTIFIVRICDDA